MKTCRTASIAIALIISTHANAALFERLGGLALYDDVANLTWLADAQAAGADMNWVDANLWANGLNVAGITGWRLPDTLQPDPSCTSSGVVSLAIGQNCTGSEMGNLFHNVFGEGNSNSPAFNANYDLFSNVPGWYWSASDTDVPSGSAWTFSFSSGYQDYDSKVTTYATWAVYTGDVSAVPVPAAAWLFSSGLLGLAGMARRKKSA